MIDFQEGYYYPVKLKRDYHYYNKYIALYEDGCFWIGIQDILMEDVEWFGNPISPTIFDD